MRHTPKTRLTARKVYWGLQQKRYEWLAAKTSVDDKLVFFESFYGRWYADSPKALYEQMLQDSRFDDFVFVWSFKSDVDTAAFALDWDRTVVVAHGRNDYFEALSMAKYLVANVRLPEYVYPMEGQAFVQCWHGTPLKKLAADVSVQTNAALNTADELAWRYAIDSRKWAYLLSASPYASEHLASAFSLPAGRKGAVVLEVGDPGNDVLVQAKANPQLACAARERLGIPAGKKALLYAPTWRDDSYKAGQGYLLGHLPDFDLLRQRIGAGWVVLFRPHYNIVDSFDFAAYDGFVIDASKSPDISECMLASDALASDYSSVIFDYGNTGKPLLLYVPDLEHYESKLHDFYFDIREVPGPLCRTSEELCDAVLALDTYHSRFGRAYEAFTERFCPFDDGHASERVLQRVFGD